MVNQPIVAKSNDKIPFSLKVVIGLGNPGKDYEMTRHNFGSLVLYELARDLGSTLQYDSRYDAYCTKAIYSDREIHLLFPVTYMNLSGSSVAKYIRYIKAGPENLLVLADDMTLDFGSMRLRASGGTQGHNGLKSIRDTLRTNDFARLGLGIGTSPLQDKASFVLAPFVEEERNQLPKLIAEAVLCTKRLCTEDFDRVARDINTIKKRNVSPKEG